MNNSTGEKYHAEIAGAGIGGLTTAAMLAQMGWSVTVHERSPTLRTYGAGIYIWSNGLRILKAIGVYDEAIKGAHIGPQFHTRDNLDETMEEIPINKIGQARLVTILREKLIYSLVQACQRNGVEIITNSPVIGALPSGELCLADGQRRKADLIVGADGINSKVRDSLDMLLYRKNLGYGATRLLLKRDDMDVLLQDRERYIEYFSGSRRILYTPASRTDLYVALCCRSDDVEAQSVPVDVNLWTKSFPNLAHLINRLGQTGRWDAFEVTKLKKWSEGRVAILGDAAHAMPPYLGQGGGCALMNGFSLARLVSAWPKNIEEALVKWEKQNRPITEHTQDTSENLGCMNDWPDNIRSQVLKIVGQSAILGQERLKTANTIIEGTEEFNL